MDDGWTEHPKLVTAGPMAALLWAAGLAYCNRQKKRTGIIPAAQVPGLFVGLRGTSVLAGRLVEVGLWEEVEGGFVIHDYHDYQPSTEEQERRNAARSAAGRLGGQRSGESRRSKAEANGEAKPKQVASTIEANAKQTREANANPDPVSLSSLISSSSRAEDPTCQVGRARRGAAKWRRVPDGWEPNADHVALARELNVNLDLELAKFRDHEFKTTKSDADATFRNWLRGARPSGFVEPKSAAAARNAAADAAWEALVARERAERLPATPPPVEESKAAVQAVLAAARAQSARGST